MSIKLIFNQQTFRIAVIEIPGGKRNLNLNAQQVILNAFISNNSSLLYIYMITKSKYYITNGKNLKRRDKIIVKEFKNNISK